MIVLAYGMVCTWYVHTSMARYSLFVLKMPPPYGGERRSHNKPNNTTILAVSCIRPIHQSKAKQSNVENRRKP